MFLTMEVRTINNVVILLFEVVYMFVKSHCLEGLLLAYPTACGCIVSVVQCTRMYAWRSATKMLGDSH